MANTTRVMDSYFRSILDLDKFKDIDSSLNGIQVDNDGSEIKKIAFAVDAGLEVFKRTIDAGAGLLFVHHGLFWGSINRIEGSYRERIKFLLDNNLSLYAVHLPLDQHPKLGNNAILAELLGLENLEPFGSYSGQKIGYKGNFSKALTVEEAEKKISYMNRPSLGILPFGKKENSSKEGE